MHLGYNNPVTDYFMDGNMVSVVHEEKDLDVVVTDDLKWARQCGEAVKIANRNDNKKFFVIGVKK